MKSDIGMDGEGITGRADFQSVGGNMLERYPFLVGVTGHRDIPAEQVEILKKQVGGLLEEIQKAAGGVQVVLLTSLAEGADMLSAEAALEKGIPFMAVLPMEVEELQEDFQGEALPRFRALLGKAARVLVAPDMEKGRLPRKFQGNVLPDRDYRYRQAGIYMVERCQMLLSLWDGGPDRSGCGTAAIMDYAEMEWNRSDRGFSYSPVIYRIHVGRSGAERTAGKEASQKGPLDAEILNRPDAGDPLAFIKGYAAAYGKETLELNRLAGKEAGSAPDKLAVSYRDRYFRGRRVTVALEIAVILFFMLYEVLDMKWALGVTLLMLAGSFVTAAATGRRFGNHLGKYIGYRLLSETERVQDFLLRLGRSYSACDFYTYGQKRSYAWVEQAARAGLADREDTAWEDEADVMESWCNGQFVYQTNAFRRDSRRLKKQNAGARIALVFSVVSYCALAFVEYAGIFSGAQAAMLINGLKILFALGSAVSLFVSDYYEKQDLGRKCGDSEKMAALYESAYQEWKRRKAAGMDTEDLVTLLARSEIEELGMWAAGQKR